MGYKSLYKPNHPKSYNNGCVKEHRFVWEQHNNAMLLPWVDVHHKNGDIKDNRIENLELFTRSEHATRHRYEARITREPRFCFICSSGTTYKTHGIDDWRRHPITKEEWICAKCYRRIWKYGHD